MSGLPDSTKYERPCKFGHEQLKKNTCVNRKRAQWSCFFLATSFREGHMATLGFGELSKK